MQTNNSNNNGNIAITMAMVNDNDNGNRDILADGQMWPEQPAALANESHNHDYRESATTIPTICWTPSSLSSSALQQHRQWRQGLDMVLPMVFIQNVSRNGIVPIDRGLLTTVHPSLSSASTANGIWWPPKPRTGWNVFTIIRHQQMGLVVSRFAPNGVGDRFSSFPI